MTKQTHTPYRQLLILAATCCLVACQTPPSSTAATPAAEATATPEPPKPVDPVVLKEQALTEGVAIYNEGRYDDAIAALTPLSTAPELPLSSQVRALKFLAFSQCVTGNIRSCRQSFDSALALDITFQLTDAERGHPVWGREFNRARAAAMAKRRSSSTR